MHTAAHLETGYDECVVTSLLIIKSADPVKSTACGCCQWRPSNRWLPWMQSSHLYLGAKFL